MKATILALILTAGALHAEPKLPASASIATFAANSAPPAPNDYFKGFLIVRADFDKIVDFTPR